MNRERKPFTRTSGVRDAKLIIIAAEGELTEKDYFHGVAISSKYRNSKVHVEFLSRGNSNSDPKACISSLNSFKKQFSLGKNDELLLVCDVDRWGSKKLSEIYKLSKQKSYLIAVSNPCFEVWLLLHHINISEYSTQKLEDLKNGGCSAVINEIRTKGFKYNKSKLRINDYINNVEHAVKQAKILDPEKLAWPNGFGSQVYLLVGSMINR